MPHLRSETFPCPNCGADVPTAALACPECGADDETGWSEDTMYDDLDLPEHDEDQTECGSRFRKSLWMLLATAAVIALLLLLWDR